MSIRIELPGRRAVALLAVCLLVLLTAGGCIHSPQMVPLNRQKLIPRTDVEYPSNCTLTRVVTGLNCPTAMCWDAGGNMYIAESGADNSEPHIFGYHKDHSYFNIYPWNRSVSFFPTGFVIHGPVGGMTAYNGRLYVSHRDRDGKGAVTALGMDGSHTTIVADLPAQGDYGVTDVIVHNNRVYFGIGSATNSGVVGLDNFDAWVKRHPGVHDEVYSPSDTPWKIYGPKFSTPNPWAGFLSPDISLTSPFQAFGHNTDSRIRPSSKPNSAILSASVDGGDCQVEAYGIRNPRGLAFGEYDHLFATNDGMELRGTRPIADDPDSLLRVPKNAWLGFPDYSTNGILISDDKFRPPLTMLLPFGYPDISPLVDQDNSGGLAHANFDLAVRGVFPALSGAAKLDFVPASGPFQDLRGFALVALDGDRTPSASNGMKLVARQGFKVALVDVEHKTVKDFVRNTTGVPASMQAWGTIALERPCDVKVGPDGAIYILDFGRMDNNSAIPHYYNGTGALFKLEAIAAPPVEQK